MRLMTFYCYVHSSDTRFIARYVHFASKTNLEDWLATLAYDHHMHVDYDEVSKEEYYKALKYRNTTA